MKQLHIILLIIIVIGILGVSGVWVNITGLWLILFGILGLTSVGTVLSLLLSNMAGGWEDSTPKINPLQIKTLFLKELGPSSFLVLGVFISAMIASPWCDYDPSLCEENLPMNRSIFIWGLFTVFILSMIPSIFRAIREKDHNRQKWIQVGLTSINRLIGLLIICYFCG